MVHRVRQLTVAAGCALVVVALGLVVAGDRGPCSLDRAVDSWFADLPTGLLHALVLPTEPYVVLPAIALLVAWCLHAGRPRDAVVVVLAPAVAVAANTWLLKPLFDRWKDDGLVYPSGHTVSLVAVLAVVVVLTERRVRASAVVVGAVLLVAAAIGMVGLGYHYVTDVVGGALFAIFVVLVVEATGPNR